MTTQEKLNAIVAKCRAFLEIAKKRTPGEWDTLGVSNSNSLRLFAGNRYLGMIGNSDADKSEVQSDAAFIAACDEQAEAMARSTIAAIEEWLDVPDCDRKEVALNRILAAWPDKLLARKS